jgi:glyceraldehyde 3-phosphate dehydrogenase
VAEGGLNVDGDLIRVSAEKDPAALPWKDLEIDIVFEGTGRFTKRDDAAKHITAGAKKVIITAPGKGDDITLVMGVNHQNYKPGEHHVISNASCTTNCWSRSSRSSERFGFVRGLMTTVLYTNDQTSSTCAEDRRAHQPASIIPRPVPPDSALIFPELKGKIDGMAMRVPTPDVSIVDLVVEVEKDVTVEEVNQAFREYASGELKGYLEASDSPLVSVDYIGSSASSIVDLLSTFVMQKRMLKVMSWYDNEWGYSARCVDLAAYVAETL